MAIDFKKATKDAEIKREIQSYLELRHILTGGHCGTTAAKLKTVLGCTYKEVAKALNELYRDDEITIQQGKDGKLIKCK